MTADLLATARAVVRDADALLVTAGAGMGVDSGLPDFRGDQGFWKAYPPYAQLGLSFVDLANPRWFRTDPTLAWGFYGHRLTTYRATRPHPGFKVLRALAARMRHGAFVYTSNVDGQFQRGGFDGERIVECHGSLDWLQCTADCGVGLFTADGVQVAVDPATFRAALPLPACPRCRALARPNVLMFGDGGWDDSRMAAQDERFVEWLASLRHLHATLVVIECGAGTAIPTVRMCSEQVVGALGGTLVRINVRESQVPPGGIGLPLGALAALTAFAADAADTP